MNRIIAPHAETPNRPLLVRVAHKWYAWTGVVLTVVGAYFAGNGQLRVGDGAHLRAAGPESVNWKPTSPPTPSNDKPAPEAPKIPDDPFKAAPAPQKPAPEVVAPKPAEIPVVPDPFQAPREAKPSLDKNEKAVLDAFMNDKNVVPAKTQNPAPLPKLTLPPLVVPPVPPPVTKGDSPAGPALPTPPPEKTSVDTTAGSNGVKPPPIPPMVAPAPLKNSVTQVPNDLVIQQPEVIPIAPKPVEKPGDKTEKKEAPPKRTPIFGKLSQDDEIKLNAAQNAARLRDFNRAAALMADIINRNPEEYALRAEYAGILLSAGDAKGAIRELERVIQISPNVAGYRLLLGDAYMGDRQYRRAAEVYLSTVEMIAQDARLAERLPEVIIRAARAYAFDLDFFRSAQLVDQYLAPIKPDDPRAPLAMGAILLDLDRPYDALPYLLEKRKQLLASPEATEEYDLKVLEVIASMVRGFARVGDRAQALEAIKEMEPRATKQFAIRVSLADILMDLKEFELAGYVYNQVLNVEPAYAPALIGVANIYLETYRPGMAKQVLDSFIPSPAYHRVYLKAYASYHQTVGEFTEAKQIYRDLLRRDENDHETRFALGRLYDYTNEWEKAKGEFAKIPPNDKMARQARLWFGYTLLDQRKFAEAAQVAAQFMQDDPNNPEAVALYVRSLSKLGQFDRAIEAGRGFLATHSRDDRFMAIVRLAVGRALLEANRNLDAAREYEILLTKPSGRVPEAYYGLARAAEKLGNANRAHEIIATLCGASGGDVRNRLIISDFYMMDHEPQKVIEILSTIPDNDNNNVAVLVRLADAQQRQATWSGNPAEAFATCQAIIRQSPTNVRGHLAMARSFAIAQNYRKAAVQYDQLIAIDPEFHVPARERARTLFSDKQFSAARSQYNVELSPTPEEMVLSQMAYQSQRDPRIRQAFAPYLNGHMGGPALRTELARLSTSCPDDEVRMSAHRLICDYDATVAWQEKFRLERDAKELKGYRNYMAVAQYQALAQFEPNNTEAFYDLGQVFGDLKQTRAELTWYGNTLAVDPIHRDASVYSERASAEISPKLDLRADYFSQRGRDNLASIDRTQYLAAARLPIGDENEFVQVGYKVLEATPTDDKTTWGNAPFARVQAKFDDSRLLTWAQVNLEIYQKYFNTRPTFDVGYQYDHNDVIHTRSGLYLENVAENGESMRQDIYRYGAYCGLDIRPTRTWSFGGTATYAHYSDSNEAIFASAYNDVSLSLPPKQLKLVQRVFMEAYKEPTIFPTNPPNPDFLFGTVHPYFSPDFFAQFEFRVEWYHWLSRDTYVHSNQCWYSLQYGISTDLDMVVYHNLRAILNYDISSCCSIGAEAATQQSSVYRMWSAMAYLQIRFLGP